MMKKQETLIDQENPAQKNVLLPHFVDSVAEMSGQRLDGVALSRRILIGHCECGCSKKMEIA